jgi:hypothetical protein
MSDVLEIWDDGNGGGFRKGKVTRRGRPLPPDEMPPAEEVVTLVHPAKVGAFLNSRDRAELLAHLSRLREQEILIHDRGRLQQSVRDQGVRRAYVFRRRSDEVPRCEPDPAERRNAVGEPFTVGV